MKLEKEGKKSLFKHPIFWILAAVVIVVIIVIVTKGGDDDLQGSYFDSNVALVRDGHPELIPNISYNQAYSHFFENAQWTGFKSTEGDDVVEFVGECTYYDEPAKVYIQFIVEGDSFYMYYVRMTVNDQKFDADDELMLDLIYTPFATYSEEVLKTPLSQDVLDAFEEAFYSIY